MKSLEAETDAALKEHARQKALTREEQIADPITLCDRLRGRYNIPIADGGGPINGSMTYTSNHTTPPIQHAAAARIEALEAALAKHTGSLPRWRHVRRGTEYTEIGRAELQVATDLPIDGEDLVIYRGGDGKLWVRAEYEFEDGRFERIEP